MRARRTPPQNLTSWLPAANRSGADAARQQRRKISDIKAIAFPAASLEWFVCGIIGGIVVCCVQLFISLVIRSFAIPIGIALAGGIGGLLATGEGWGLNYPYSLYSMGMRANKPQMEIDLVSFVVNSMGYIIIFAALSVFYLRKHEMATG